MSNKFYLLGLLLVGMAIGFASAGWLDESSSSYREIKQHFTDPIFYTNPTSSQQAKVHSQYYPYFGSEFFRDPKPNITTVTLKSDTVNALPPYARISDFRISSLQSMQWPEFQKNWSSTMDYAKSSSSFRIYNGTGWANV